MTTTTALERPVVGRNCSVCSHPLRVELESALASGSVSIRAAAEQFGVGRESLRRHVRAHLALSARAAINRVQGLDPLDLAGRLVQVADHARELRLDADDRGDDRLALQAGRAEIAALEVLAERTGITKGEVMQAMEEAVALVSALRNAVFRNPEIAAPIVDQLDSFGATRLARDIHQYAEKSAELAANPVSEKRTQ